MATELFNHILSHLWFRVNSLRESKEWRNPINQANFGIPNPSDAVIVKGNELIKTLIQTEKPFFIGRYGTIELGFFLRGYRYFLRHDFSLPNVLKAIVYTEPECWGMGGGNGLQTNAGVFPLTDDAFHTFTDIYYASTKQLDVLASWQKREVWLRKYGLLGTRVRDIDYNILEYAYRLSDPWTEFLAGKKVLIVSPFAQDIKKQYESKRAQLFCNQDFLPEFTLLTVTSVNTAGSDPLSSGYKSWAEALEVMEEEVRPLDFDIALLGCGAYAFPLGAFIKSELGKQAITVCGALQTYFGVYGGRTKNLPEVNDYWIRPSQQSRPQGFKRIEGGAYW